MDTAVTPRLMPAHKAPRWLLALTLLTACDEEDREARERHDKEQRERLLEMDARIARLEARLARLETPPPAPVRKLTLELTADGVRLGDVPLDPPRLATRLREEVEAARPGEVELTVRAPADVGHARVLETIDLARTAGIVRINMDAITPNPPAP